MNILVLSPLRLIVPLGLALIATTATARAADPIAAADTCTVAKHAGAQARPIPPAPAGVVRISDRAGRPVSYQSAPDAAWERDIYSGGHAGVYQPGCPGGSAALCPNCRPGATACPQAHCRADDCDKSRCPLMSLARCRCCCLFSGDDECDDDDWDDDAESDDGSCMERCHWRCAKCLRTFFDRDLEHKLLKLGYFFPSGCGGAGCPPVGCYGIAYAHDPNYFDERDGRLYAAQGYGAPMAVPLAPNVEFTYNYGWGIPASRLTNISRVSPRVPAVVVP